MRGTRKVGPSFFFFFVFCFFHVCAFSMQRHRLSRSLEQGVNSYLKKNTFRKTMIYFGLLISSLISENELIHVFNCFKINSMTAHKSESRSTFVKKILFIYNIT